ncbi:CU044_5270 family protein [Streptomyces sp. NPDC020965]|uniref:CU044_5270 family protein n=1 Tax=Streptomyces sp. NPDC020965 TaxID=3365105 RepID=UPI0037984F02
MNPEQQERSDRERATRVLPPVDHPELTPARVHARRQHLLNEFGGHASRSAPIRRLFPGRRMVLVLGAATAVGATVFALGLGTDGTTARQDGPPASAASVQWLEKAALAANAKPILPVRADQYSYVKVVGHTTVLSEKEGGGMERLREDESMEQWTSVNGSERTMQRKGGNDQLLPDPQGKANLNSPTYNFLAALPTDPAVLLKRIHDDAVKNHGGGSDSTTGPDQQAFVTIGDLLRGSVAPPATTAALYRAAALIPGVVTVPDAVDATGRHGTAVARVHDGERTEWIFDKSTVRLLGERTVLTKDNAWGKAGTVVTSVALMTSGIVDRAGQVQ